MVDEQHEKPADLEAASLAPSAAERERSGDDASTDAVLQRELDTLDSILGSPPAPANRPRYVDESGCQRVVKLVAAIGRDPSVAPGDAVAPVDESQAPPMETLGQYKLMAKLGQGGMGAVYKALHTRLQKVVALKVLPADKLKDEDAVARFDREMRAVGQLNHPNIIAAHDAGEIAGNHYLVMELVDGIDVSALVKRFQEAVPADIRSGSQVRRGSPDPAETSDREVSESSDGGRPVGQPECGVGRPVHNKLSTRGLPVPEACEIIRQTAEGLQHAHEHGMVHRDIKPSNLMVTRIRNTEVGMRNEDAPDSSAVRTPDSAFVKLLDLGLALFDDRHQKGGKELTGTGQMMGTIDYMAPEQGGDSHKVDIRADIYAMGATLYKLLAGRAPFADERYEAVINKLMALATETPTPLHELREDIPRELSDFVARLLSKRPDQRPATPREVADALTPFTEGARLGDLLQFVEQAHDTETDRTSDTFAHLSSSFTDTHRPATVRPTPSTVVGPKPATRRWLPIAGGIAIVFIAAALAGPWLWGTLFKIETPQGTITIEVPAGEEDNIEISVRQGGKAVEVLDADNGWTIRVMEGKYQLDVKKGGDRFAIENDTLTVTRDVNARVKIILKAAQVALPDQKSAPRGNGSYRTVVKLTELEPLVAEAGFRGYLATTKGEGGPLLRPDVKLAKEYIFTHAPSRIRYAVPTGMKSFTGVAFSPSYWTVAFKVMVGDKTLYEYSKDGRDTIRIDLPPDAEAVDLLSIWTHPKDRGSAFWIAPRFHPAPVDEVRDLFGEEGDHVTLTGMNPLLIENNDTKLLINRVPEDVAPPVALDMGYKAVGRIPADAPEQCKEFIYANPQSRAEYAIPTGATAFSAIGHSLNGGVHFEVYANERRLYRSPSAGIVPINVEIPNRSSVLALVVTGSRYRSESRWCYPRFHLGDSEASKRDSDSAAGTVEERADAGVAHALEFEKSKQTCVEIPTLRFDGTKPITVEAWVKAPAGANGTIVGSSQRAGCALYANGHFGVRQGHAGGGSFTFAATDWMPPHRAYHLAATFDGETIQVFADGKPVKGTIATGGGYRGAPFSFKIGARPSGRGGSPEAFFTGMIDEIRISSVVRYEEEFVPAEAFQTDEHTLALYCFEEGQGELLGDSSGNNHHGRIVGAKWVARPAAEVFGGE